MICFLLTHPVAGLLSKKYLSPSGLLRVHLKNDDFSLWWISWVAETKLPNSCLCLRAFVWSVFSAWKFPLTSHVAGSFCHSSQVKHLPEGPSQTPPSQQFPREPPSRHSASFLPPHSSNTGIFLLNCSVSGSSHNITSMRKGTWSPLFFAVSLMLFSSPFPVISYSFLILLTFSKKG